MDELVGDSTRHGHQSHVAEGLSGTNLADQESTAEGTTTAAQTEVSHSKDTDQRGQKILRGEQRAVGGSSDPHQVTG